MASCRHQICRISEYCDSVLNFCRPCSFLCNGDTRTECKELCPHEYAATTESPQTPPADASSSDDINLTAIILGAIVALFVIAIAVLLIFVLRRGSDIDCSRNGKVRRGSTASNSTPTGNIVELNPATKAEREGVIAGTREETGSHRTILLESGSKGSQNSLPIPQRQGTQENRPAQGMQYGSQNLPSQGNTVDVRAQIEKHPSDSNGFGGRSAFLAQTGSSGILGKAPSFSAFSDIMYASQPPEWSSSASHHSLLLTSPTGTGQGHFETRTRSQQESGIAQPEATERHHVESTIAQPESDDQHPGKSMVLTSHHGYAGLHEIQALLGPGALGRPGEQEAGRQSSPRPAPHRSRSGQREIRETGRQSPPQGFGERESLLGAVGGEEPRTEIHPHAPIGDEIREKSLSELAISFGNEPINELGDDYRNFVRRLPGFQRVLLHRDGVIIVHATPEEYRNAAERLIASVWCNFRHRVLPDPEMQDIETGQLHLCVGGDRATYRHLPGSRGQTVDHFHLSDDMPTLPPEIPPEEAHHQMTVLPPNLDEIPGVTVRTQAPPPLASSSFDWSSSASALALPALGYQAQIAMMWHTSDEDNFDDSDDLFPAYNAAGYQPAPVAPPVGHVSGSSSWEPAVLGAAFASGLVLRRNDSRTVSRSASVSDGNAPRESINVNGFIRGSGPSGHGGANFDSTLPSRSMQSCPLREEQPVEDSTMALLASRLSRVKADDASTQSDRTSGYCTTSTLETCENTTTINDLSSSSVVRSTARNSYNV